jgi:hypothetical protein
MNNPGLVKGARLNSKAHLQNNFSIYEPLWPLFRIKKSTKNTEFQADFKYLGKMTRKMSESAKSVYFLTFFLFHLSQLFECLEVRIKFSIFKIFFD